VYYSQVVSDILSYAGQTTGGQAEDIVKRMVNVVYFRVLEEVDTPYEEREFTISSVASQRSLGMPLWVRKILNIEDTDTPRMLNEASARMFDRTRAGSTETGTPANFFVSQSRGVQAQPSADGTVTVESDDAGDYGSDHKVRLEGFDTSGNLVSELITLTGTTPVTSANSYSSSLGLERIVKAPAAGATFTGSVTLKDSAGNSLAVIPVAWESPDFVWIEFDPIPGSAISYTVRAEMRVPPLVNDFDWPKFDEQFHDLLIWGVTQDLLAAWGKPDTAGAHRLTFSQRLDEFRGRATTRPAAIHVLENVQAYSGFRQRPTRPLIKGVDFGLA